MTFSVALFAQFEGLNPLNPTLQVSKSSGLVLKDMLLIIGTSLVLAAVLFVWARYYVRHKPKRTRVPSRERSPIMARVVDDPETDAEDPSHGRRRRRRRRRRGHRPRNPTLAETGGLPPAKQEGAPPQTS